MVIQLEEQDGLVERLHKQPIRKPLEHEDLMALLDLHVHHRGMSKEKFLEELEKIVPEYRRLAYINARQAAEVCMLLLKYRGLDMTSHHYTDSTVRVMRNDKRLASLSDEEYQEIFGAKLRILWFRLSDVLALSLTRWPHPSEPKPKRGRGRPPKFPGMHKDKHQK